MQRIAQTVLGGVLDLPSEQSALLLQTLAVWRDNGGSATATARQMFCHPNTLRQRLRKLESCTGRSLTDPLATAELLLALQAILLLPPPALRDAARSQAGAPARPGHVPGGPALSTRAPDARTMITARRLGWDGQEDWLRSQAGTEGPG